MDEDIHLPWDRASLEALLRKIVETGEASKVDLKRSFEMADGPQQAEFLKDVAAIANTYNHHYRNHGFLIFGAQNNAIVGCAFPDNEDHLQARVDDLVKRYLGPFITTHIFQFSEGDKQWGAVVIPPTRSAPHVFIADIHKRVRGEVYVRSGTTTTKAQPEDYARFFRQYLEEQTYVFHENISDLRRTVTALEKRLPQSKRNLPSGADDTEFEPQSQPQTATPAPTRSLTDRINAALVKEEDLIARSLLEEARKIDGFLRSGEVPWACQVLDKQRTTETLQKIEEVCQELWLAIISLAARDEKGAYDDALLRAVSYLAKAVDPPLGVSFTELGRNLRYYPLIVALYLICITGVSKKRDKLLKKVLKLELQGRSRYDEPLPITYALFMIRRAGEFFQPLHQDHPRTRLCDPIATFIKSLTDRLLDSDDPLWDKETDFYAGECVLSISPLDSLEKATNRPMIGHPSSGLFLYASEATPIINRFLRKEIGWIQRLFDRPLDEVLAEFDKMAPQLASPGCWTTGFAGGALEAAFPDKAKSH
jgi:hypothetical protein